MPGMTKFGTDAGERHVESQSDARGWARACWNRRSVALIAIKKDFMTLSKMKPRTWGSLNRPFRDNNKLGASGTRNSEGSRVCSKARLFWEKRGWGAEGSIRKQM